MSILGVIVPTVGVMKPYPWEQAWSSIQKKKCFVMQKSKLFWSNALFKLIICHDALYCCVRYSNMEYQGEIFKSYH